jgi:hypothetical protein
MGKIKFSLCLKKKKQAKKSIFAPKIAPRVERSDLVRNSYFPADFLSAGLQCSQFLHNWRNIEINSEKIVSILYGILCPTAHRPIPQV